MAHCRDNEREVPRPRSIDEVRRDAAAEYDAKSESLVMIPVVLDRARPVRANISMDAGTLEAIDEEAARRGLTRSSFLASAAMDKIGPCREAVRPAYSFAKGTEVRPARDKKGQFKDIQTRKTPHGQYSKRKDKGPSGASGKTK